MNHEAALRMYNDLREQGLSASAARQHVLLMHDVDVAVPR